MGARPQNLSRRSVAVAGWSGDEATARLALASHDEVLRASALVALARMNLLSIPDLRRGLVDGHPHVRRRALSLVPAAWATDRTAAPSLDRLLDDDDATVVEFACFVAGECLPAPTPVVERLVEICTSHDDALCRESAVAALGAIGDPSAVHAVLAACRDKATVRRRAVLALAAFDGDEVDDMLVQLTTDVDWQVRQAAEELAAIV